MPTLAEIRTQYPQYQDMPDAELAGALHKKFYSDMPYEAFAKKVGAAESAPASVKNSPVGGFIRGVRDPIDAGAQMLERGAKAIGIDTNAINQKLGMPSADEATKTAETDYRQNWRGGQAPKFDTGRIAGNIAATAPLSMAMPGAGAVGLGARMASGAASGAASGLLEPVDNEAHPDFWGEKGKQAAVGGLLGGAAPAAIGAAARVVKPNTKPAVTSLLDAGVTPTPGQIMGGSANRLEEAATSIPLVGDAIKGARTRAVEQFNRASIDKALAPIGERLGKDTAMGHDAIAEAAEKISNSYNKLVPQLTVGVDQKFGASVSNLQNLAQNMPKDRAAQFDSILKREVLGKFSEAGVMSGETFKEVESELTRQISRYKNSSVGDERLLGDALMETRNHLRQLLFRSNPDRAADLTAANSAYANLMRVQGAAAYLGAQGGVFSPAHLLSAVKAGDKSQGKRTFAKGDALLQDFAESGKDVLGSKVPDSGTPFRSLTNIAALSGLGIGHSVDPMSAALVTGAGAGAAAAYSSPGQKILAALLAKRPDLAGPIAQKMRQLGPLASSAAGPVQGLLQ